MSSGKKWERTQQPFCFVMLLPSAFFVVVVVDSHNNSMLRIYNLNTKWKFRVQQTIALICHVLEFFTSISTHDAHSSARYNKHTA